MGDTCTYREGRKDGPTKCAWYPGHPGPSPHTHCRSERPKILDSIDQFIGQTPMVRLNRIPKEEGVECEVLAKCEFFNSGGSVKDRIGKRMVEEAEKEGRIKPGDTLIEATSGNTGIGLALAAATKGYKMIITMPEKMSQEKVDVLKALGAQIVRTPDGTPWDSPESLFGVAERLHKEIPNSHILDQYKNAANPLVHYDETAEEILEATDGKIDMVVLGVGTGGTIVGIARKLKEKIPGVQVIGVDPLGSSLAEPPELNETTVPGYKVEGIGYDFIPTVLDRSAVDEWIKCDDPSSFVMARRLLRDEGLFCGGSSGSCVSAAMKVAKRLAKDQRCVVVLPDSIRNYMSKHLSDDWMDKLGFVSEEHNIGIPEHKVADRWWSDKHVDELELPTPRTISENATIQEVIDLMAGEGYEQVPVLGSNGAIRGVVTEGNLVARLGNGKVKPEDSVTRVLFTQFRVVSRKTTLSQLASIFDYDYFALVRDGPEEPVSAIVRRIDLLTYVSKE
eukprot:gb/GECG01003445.1/.p1 GENE.gb/GECG01003445.1/~~gb/GECG01003445.1/.p1  ORF type:complete len:506 (+),score=63.12 gb/GECG01003445.1/:1-1518(+)